MNHGSNDYIDLDAFIRNVVRRYFNLCISENDYAALDCSKKET